MRLALLVLLIAVAVGCDASRDEGPPTPTPTPRPELTTPAPEINKWQEEADSVEPEFLRAAAKVHSALQDKSTIVTAIDICKALANYEGDTALIADVRKAADENNSDARLSPEEAAMLARLTNERICPDLAP